MDIQKNRTLVVGASAAIAGLLLGWFIWSPASCCGDKKMGMHQMADGRMMRDRDMGSMQAMMDDMSLSLAGKSGDEFDKAFIEEMIIHHQGAIDMAKLALTSAKHQEIKNLAGAIISAQTSEINQMRQWKSAWFK